MTVGHSRALVLIANFGVMGIGLLVELKRPSYASGELVRFSNKSSTFWLTFIWSSLLCDRGRAEMLLKHQRNGAAQTRLGIRIGRADAGLRRNRQPAFGDPATEPA